MTAGRPDVGPDGRPLDVTLLLPVYGGAGRLQMRGREVAVAMKTGSDSPLVAYSGLYFACWSLSTATWYMTRGVFSDKIQGDGGLGAYGFLELRISNGISVAHKDIEIDVTEGHSLLGTLKISRGSLDWRPAKRSVNLYRLNWAEFAELIQNEGHAIRVTGRPVAKKAPAKRGATKPPVKKVRGSQTVAVDEHRSPWDSVA